MNLSKIKKILGLILASTVFSFSANFSLVFAEDSGTLWKFDLGSTAKTQIEGIEDIIAISNGLNHSLALRKDGTVWAWGDNTLGQLGNGTSGNNSSVPIQVKLAGENNYLTGIKAIAAGDWFSVALKQDGTVWVWGVNNNNGNLGVGEGQPLKIVYPTQVINGLNGYLTDVAAISAGGQHTLALKYDSTVVGWGQNYYRQLGVNCSEVSDCNNLKFPIQVYNLSNVKSIGAGNNHSVAVKTDGSVWGWGLASSGQLGPNVYDPNAGAFVVGSPIQIESIDGIEKVSTKKDFNIVLSEDGKVYSWGGRVSSLIFDDPTEIAGLDNIKEISAGYVGERGYGIALKNDGTVWSWVITNISSNLTKQNNLTEVNAIAAHVVTGTYLPNLAVVGNSLSSTLNVPYFSQNIDPWGPSEYDHTDDLGVGGLAGSMDRWGCAVTSVAMVLNYHNMKQFPNGTAIDPGSVNQWLKDNGGYSYGYGKDGWYSSIIWNKVSVLTQQLHAAGKAPYKLEWQRRYPNPASTTLLNNDLTEGNSLAKIPNILFVNNKGHFIVAKGVIGDTYAVNDPEWNYPTLASFNNTYSQIDRFVPSHTDLSYIVAVVNPDVEILVTDSQGRRVGKSIQNGQSNAYDEIPGASYSYEPPIKNPNELGIEENLGTGVNMLLLPKPDEGEYTISLTGETQTNYTLNVTTFEVDGDNEVHKSEGLLAQDESNTLDLGYSQTQPSNVAIAVSFQSLIDDVTELRALGHIAHKSVANSLIRNVKQAQKASLENNTNKVIQNLEQFISILERERGRRINERAYNILNNNVNRLKQDFSI